MPRTETCARLLRAGIAVGAVLTARRSVVLRAFREDMRPRMLKVVTYTSSHHCTLVAIRKLAYSNGALIFAVLTGLLTFLFAWLIWCAT